MIQPIVKELKNLATITAAHKGYEIVALEMMTHMNPITIQVQIRHSSGKSVSLEDCSLLSNPISDAFEKLPSLLKPYVLEISSPGISDELITDQDFKTFRGFPIEVVYRGLNESHQKKDGLLHERTSNHLNLNIKGKMNLIPLEKIIRVRLTTASG